MKPVLCYIALMFSLPLAGQLPVNSDTIRIAEVIISRSTAVNSQAYKKVQFDSTVIYKYRSASLSDLLSENSHIFIKSYGPGGIATSMLRGTGAGHTQLLWNGINIGNPMLGQADLSLVPAGLIDDIRIWYGGGSLGLTSGGVGGAISLETLPDWQKENYVSFSTAVGSFGKYSGLIKLKTGNEHFQSVTKAFMHSAKNNFRYLNMWNGIEPVWEKRQNNSILQKGFLQELYFRGRESSASARVWYQSASRTLPAPVITRQITDDEKQQDESLKALLNYHLPRGSNNYKIAAAAIFDRLNYTNRTASIDSRNFSATFFIKTEMETMAGENTRLQFAVNEEISMINSNNFDGRKLRNTISLTASAENYTGERIGGELLIREIIFNNKLLFPDFFAGLTYRLTKETENLLKAGFSRNSRLPSMNDMYWMPGGNPELRNEYSYSCELTYETKYRAFSFFDISQDITFYRNNIRNMIKWSPGEYTYWTPENIGNVIASGVESALDLSYSVNNYKAGLSTGYTFTRAVNRNKPGEITMQNKDQLTYIPASQLHGKLYFMYKTFYTDFLTNYTGRRYITADNTQYLPEYIYSDLIFGHKLNTRHASFDLSLSIENIFNADYQVIAYYPMPGRSFSVRLLIHLTK